jgi:predicted kinase
MVVIVTGLPGSGKSFFASQLAKGINADYINSDQVRKTMMPPGHYSLQEKRSVYGQMLAQAITLVNQKRKVVLDATFYNGAAREQFKDALSRITPVKFIEVTATKALIKDRLRLPRKDSEADYEVYKKIRAAWEPLQEPHLVLQSTNNNIAALLEVALDYLKK